MSKKSGNMGKVEGFEYNCNCGKHFVSVGDAVSHINRFRDHHLTRVTIG